MKSEIIETIKMEIAKEYYLSSLNGSEDDLEMLAKKAFKIANIFIEVYFNNNTVNKTIPPSGYRKN